MLFFQRCLYVQLSPQRLTVRDPRTGTQFSEVPEVAIAKDAKGHRIAGIGTAARTALAGLAGEVVNPFAHPRSLVSDFTVAEQLLRTVVRQLMGNGILRLAPRIVMHPLGEHEGGLTQVELRAFREMALGAGASDVVLWRGPVLTDQQLLDGDYPTGGQVFE